MPLPLRYLRVSVSYLRLRLDGSIDTIDHMAPWYVIVPPYYYKAPERHQERTRATANHFPSVNWRLL